MSSILAASIVPSIALAADRDDGVPATPPASTTPAATTMDAVHLRNGGLFRGRVTEIVPGDHVTVVIAPNNETKRVPWAEVDRVIVASTPIPPPPTAAAPAPTTAPMNGPRAHVHITTKRKVILYRRAAGTSAFVQACTSPCDEELPIGDTYRLAGNGLSQNKEFQLEASAGGSVDLVVDPPSTGGMILGGFLAGTGATAAYVGLLMALVGAADSSGSDCYSNSSYCSTSSSDAKSVRNAGLVTLVVGAGVTALGIVVFLNSASTDVSQRAGGAAHDGKANDYVDAWVRKPTWSTAGSGATGAPPVTFPLSFTTTF